MRRRYPPASKPLSMFAHTYPHALSGGIGGSRHPLVDRLES